MPGTPDDTKFFWETFVTLPELQAETKSSKSSIYRQMKLGLFPQRRKLGATSRVVWLRSEIEAWKATVAAGDAGVRAP